MAAALRGSRFCLKQHLKIPKSQYSANFRRDSASVSKKIPIFAVLFGAKIAKMAVKKLKNSNLTKYKSFLK